MKIVNLTQGSPEWLTWRKTGIGGSDAIHVSGGAPWSNPRQLWEEKTGQRSHGVTLARMERGTRLEPTARKLLNDLTGANYVPVCVVHDQHPWLKASLDGLSEDRLSLCEIKCPGDKVHRKIIRRGRWPDYYFPQLQHNLLASGCDVALFVSYHPDFPPDQRLIVLPCYPDRPFMERLFEGEEREQRAIETRTWPPGGAT